MGCNSLAIGLKTSKVHSEFMAVYFHDTQYLHTVSTNPLPVTPRGNKYIATVTDYFSKWPEAAPLFDKTAVGVANFLFKLFCHYGWPEVIISDQGREFI